MSKIKSLSKINLVKSNMIRRESKGLGGGSKILTGFLSRNPNCHKKPTKNVKTSYLNWSSWKMSLRLLRVSLSFYKKNDRNISEECKTLRHNGYHSQTIPIRTQTKLHQHNKIRPWLRQRNKTRRKQRPIILR